MTSTYESKNFRTVKIFQRGEAALRIHKYMTDNATGKNLMSKTLSQDCQVMQANFDALAVPVNLKKKEIYQ